MTNSDKCQKLRTGLKNIRGELESLREILSGSEAEIPPPQPAATNGQRENFFDQITQNEPLPEGDELKLRVLRIITGLGYASIMALQHKLEVNYGQATRILADLERDELIGPAHGFRPHKVLPSAYELLEKIESDFNQN